MTEQLTISQARAAMQLWETQADVPTGNPYSNNTIRGYVQSELALTQERLDITADAARARLATDVREERRTRTKGFSKRYR